MTADHPSRVKAPVSPLVRQARHQVGQEIKMGRLVRPDHCARCGAEDRRLKDGRTSIQAHHHNGYDRPLVVEWLCVGCHRKLTPAPYGTRAPAAKLDWGAVDAIRARYLSGEGYYSIAADVGLHPTTVHKIVTYRTWPDLARPVGEEQKL